MRADIYFLLDFLASSLTASCYAFCLRSLSGPSRSFYENARTKQVYSLAFTAMGFMLLGFCSYSGGEAEANKIDADNVNLDFEKDAYESLVGGYGFAAFLYILASIMMFAMSIYISPLCCGYVVYSFFLCISKCLCNLCFP
jgi:hypothetical protein